MAATGSINFGGLVSGLDTNQLIDDLIKIDSQPLTRLQNRQTDLTEKRDTFTTMKSDLLEFQSIASELKTASSFGAFSASSSYEEALTVSASSTANEGNYSIKILSLAQAETLSGNSYASTDTDLGISGEILINNSSLTIRKTDSLTDIKNSINSLDSGVTASILKITSSDYRLILSSNTRGEDGFRIANVGSADALGLLGLTDGTTSVRSAEDGSVYSAAFSSANSTLGSLLDLSSQSSGTVTIRNKNITINLASDTLSAIRDKINESNIPGVTASVETVVVDSETMFRLAITGTEEFEDEGNVLETLGILERGVSGTYAEFQTGPLSVSKEMSEPVHDTTLLRKLGANVGETITISGSDTEGSRISSTITVGNDTKVGDILDAIESAFGDDVEAYIENDRIKVKSTVAGANSLSFRIRAGNEYEGSLDFGSVSTVTRGRDRLLVQGSDAKIVVNNIEISRNTNEISDVLTGLSLSLKNADPNKQINISVVRDRSAVKGKIENFVKSYNEFIDFIDQNSAYNEETDEEGPLLGDITSRTVVSKIRDVLRSTVFDGDFTYNQLVQIGVETTTDGKLKINSSKLDDALNEDVDSVVSLFTATRKSSDNDISFVYHSNKTAAGTYNVTITRAAEQAEAVSRAFDGDIGENGTLTVTDNYNRTLSVAYTEGMSVEDIANSINEEAEQSYSEIIRSDSRLKQANDVPIAQNTSITDIQGVDVRETDTITVSGTTHTGKTYQRVIGFGDGEDVTVQDILQAIESINNYEVVASIDSNGSIVVEDRTSGTSKLAVSITSTVPGLDFGVFESIQQGRSSVSVTAEVTEDNTLKIIHNEYGSAGTFTVSGGASLGIDDGVYVGIDVEGTINGSAATGRGQTLTASGSDSNTRGIVIRTTITPGELAAEGQNQGTVTLISGVADKLYSLLSSMTSSVDGFIQAKIDSIDLSLSSLESQIDNMNDRIDLRRQQYVRKFTELEQSLARLQSLQESLTSSLSSIQTNSLFSSL